MMDGTNFWYGMNRFVYFPLMLLLLIICLPLSCRLQVSAALLHGRRNVLLIIGKCSSAFLLFFHSYVNNKLLRYGFFAQPSLINGVFFLVLVCNLSRGVEESVLVSLGKTNFVLAIRYFPCWVFQLKLYRHTIVR